MNNRPLLTTAGSVVDLLCKLTNDIDEMNALLCAIEDRAMDGGGGLERGSVAALHLETLARIGTDIAERNANLACNTICALQAVINASNSAGEAA